MILRFYRYIIVTLALSIMPYHTTFAQPDIAEDLIIVGGGIAGAMEALFAYFDAKAKNITIRIRIYDKLTSILESTATRIAPSLTCDELLSVVPRGSELVKKLEILFSNPGGIRVDDVEGINESDVTELFKDAVYFYSLDEIGHNQRTEDLLALGKMSMDLWQQLYDNADPELKQILELSNFNPCCELVGDRALHKGYRIDLIYNVADAKERAETMKHAYESLGYTHCALLTPEEVMALDPFLAEFCAQHSHDNVWHSDAIALWRPGGCINAQEFIPRLYDYLKKAMGTYTNAHGQQEDCFQLHLGKKVTHLTFAHDTITDTTKIIGLNFSDGEASINDNAHYVFCPGAAVGTLKNLGLCEPALDGFPTLGFVYQDNGSKIINGRCTTHLGSGGVSFSPAVTVICRQAMNSMVDPFAKRILEYGNSTRVAKLIL